MYKKSNFCCSSRENDKTIKKSVRNSKTLWQIIKKEPGNSFPEIENISLKMDSMLVTNPQDVSQQFNELFVNSIDKIGKIVGIVGKINGMEAHVSMSKKIYKQNLINYLNIIIKNILRLA
jgi:hypothetical protein